MEVATKGSIDLESVVLLLFEYGAIEDTGYVSFLLVSVVDHHPCPLACVPGVVLRSFRTSVT